jgi:hypothetical protein
LKSPEQILITRYNAPISFEGLPADFSPLDPDWLDERHDLFMRFCLPSVEEQTDQAFTWLFFFHPKTPKYRYAHLRKRYKVLFATSHAEIVAGVRKYAKGGKGPLITTRLDNDDSLARDFVASNRSVAKTIVRNAGPLGLPHALIFRTGIIRDVATGRIYYRDFPDGPLGSLLEDRGSGQTIQTVYAQKHGDVPKMFNTTSIRGHQPMWSINVHGGNAHNRLHGRIIVNEFQRKAVLSCFAGEAGQ